MTVGMLCAIVAITNAMGTVAVDTHGARVVSYVPVGGEEVFFASKTGTGGMPVCWPWFGGLGPEEGARRHGVARYHDFKVVGIKRHSWTDSELTLRLESDAGTRREFPHDFALTVSVRLTDRLTVSMTGENTGTSPFEVTEAIHPYFAVADSRQCRVVGADLPEYALVDPVGGRTLSFSDAGGAELHVWRPDANSHLSKSVAPIADDDWMRFLCVENGRFKKKDAYVLKPGEKHTLSRTIRLSMTHANARPIDLQTRIDAVAATGGGRVVVPPGEWLAEKAIQLRSNVELHLSEGAVLTFPDDPAACLPEVRTSFSCIEYYGLSPLVHAYGATNVAVTGKGTIAPRMAFWREWFNRNRQDSIESMGTLYAWGEGDTPVEERRFDDLRAVRLRPSCIEFERCGNVRLEDFHIRESPLWCVHLRLCENVTVRGIDIRARGANNDGIDINASKNVLVENCVLDQGDDGFVIKSGRDRDGRRVGVPCENVEIRNCVIKGGHTLIAVGSEVSGGIRNISLHDCVVDGNLQSQLASIKTSDRKGAFIENVAVSNVTMRGSVQHVAAVRTNIDYQWGRYPARERIVTRIEGFRVENIRADSAQCVYHLSGDPRLPVKNVTLKNIHVGTCRKASLAENVEGLVVRDVVVATGTTKTIKVANGRELAAAVRSIGAIRASNRDVPVEILLAAGDYDVPSGIALREGRGFVSSDVAPVTIRAAQGARSRLFGGRVVKDWRRTRFNGRDDVWVADVSALKLRGQLPLFFCDGASMTLCRRPNADPRRPYSGGWAYVPGEARNMYKDFEGERDDEVHVRPEDWVDRARIDEGRICIFPRFNWWNKVLPIGSCDPTNHVLRFAKRIGGGGRGFAPRANDRYHFMGYREDLDLPGEWYHDLSGGKVYFIPPDGADPNTKRTVVASDESLAVFRLDGVTNVVIRGLEICEAPGGVKMHRVDGCEVVACSLHDIGFFSGNAVTVISGTRCAVRDCDIWNIGAYGINVSGGRNGKYAPDMRDGNVVENNYIHHTGLVNRHGFGVIIDGQGSRVSHNLMHDMPRGGIFYAGRFLTVDWNRIRHVNLEMEDTAAIYGGGFVNNTGTKICNNWVSHSVGFSHDKAGVYSFRKTLAWGIYLDDCSGGATVCGNLVERCNGGAMHMHCARFNVVSNNVFVSNGGESQTPRQFSIRGWRTTDKGFMVAQYLPVTAQKMYDRLLSVSSAWTNYPALSYPPCRPDAPDGYIMRGNRIVNNIWFYPDQSESFLYVPSNYNVSNNVFDANIVWDGSGTVKMRHEGRTVTLAEWRAKGQEKSSVFADPLFRDPAHGDWSFREGSPALALGIAPIHPEKAGLYINENRKSLPVEAEGAREHPEWLEN